MHCMIATILCCTHDHFDIHSSTVFGTVQAEKSLCLKVHYCEAPKTIDNENLVGQSP